MKRRSLLLTPLGLAMAGALAGGGASSPDVTHKVGGKTGLVHDPRCLRHSLGAYHPESPRRLTAIMEALGSADVEAEIGPLEHEVTGHLLRVHDGAHRAAIAERYPLSHDIALLGVAAGLRAVDQVCSGAWRNAFCAVRPPGHHARNTGREEGFCFFNSVAVAARYAQHVHGVGRIAIVDWDYHHGNGTEETFYADPSVLFFSTHDARAYPGTGDPARRGTGAGAGTNFNVHLDCGAGDAELLRAFREQLVPALAAFRPELILVSAGFDGARGDPLGCFLFSADGFAAVTRLVMEQAQHYCGGRVISLLEGGYNLEATAAAAAAHVRALSSGA